MWEAVRLPKYISERFIGFSLPLDNEIALISYEAIHIVDISSGEIVVNDNSVPEGGELFDKSKNILSYIDKTYTIYGLFGGEPILHSPKGEELLMDNEELIIKVQEKTGQISFQFHYEDLSGDWCFGTFSKDGKYVLLGLPYDFYAFIRV